MATMADILGGINTGLEGLNTPLGQFGTQLLAQSGPQAGNPGGVQRLGQALQGMSEMQRVQALQQYRQQQIQLAEQQQQMTLQQQQAKQAQAQRQQAVLQDPNFLASLTPMARQMAQLGVDPGELIRAQNADNLQAHRDAQLKQQAQQFDARLAHVGAGGNGGGGDHGPKVPTPRQVLEEPLENGMMQRHVFDAATGQYKPYGKPYRQYAPGKADPLAGLLGDVMPDDNTDQGPAVPGLPGSDASTKAPSKAPQGAELLMHGSGSNPMARKPAVTAQGPATPKTKADYDALPAGAAYVDPASGKVAIKRGA